MCHFCDFNMHTHACFSHHSQWNNWIIWNQDETADVNQVKTMKSRKLRCSESSGKLWIKWKTISTAVRMFPPRWKCLHRGGNVSTAVEIISTAVIIISTLASHSLSRQDALTSWCRRRRRRRRGRRCWYIMLFSTRRRRRPRRRRRRCWYIMLFSTRRRRRRRPRRRRCWYIMLFSTGVGCYRGMWVGQIVFRWEPSIHNRGNLRTKSDARKAFKKMYIIYNLSGKIHNIGM